MSRFLAASLTVWATVSLAAPALSDANLAVGQIWSSRARPGETGSTVTILKLEKNDDLGEIAHIRIDGIKMKSPSAPGGLVDFIGHMPYDVSALKKSPTEEKGTTKSPPEFQEGYPI